VRARSELVVQPLWWLAGLPGRLGQGLHDDARLRSQLSAENKVLRNALLISGARLARLQTATAENGRLRGLLGAAERGGLDVQLAPILDIDLDPTRQRLILDAGSRDGVQMGQSVIDAGGLLGQIIAVMPGTSTVLLLTDPDHAVPVVVARTGVRLVAYGKGRSDQLQLLNVPLSSDVKVGDSVITSGLGGRFPSGFAVGTVTRLEPDDSRAFLVGDVRPAAQLDRGRDVLLLRQTRVALAPAATTPPAVTPPASTSTSTPAPPATGPHP
jgi:rod shape-determining protein MreC